MKKTALAFVVLGIALLALATGCAQPSGQVQTQGRSIEQPDTMIIDQAPPAPKKEAVAPAPGPNYAYAWVPGYWAWQGKWVWTSGTWVPLPSPHTEWVAGHWIPWGHRYKWIPGRWQ